MHNGFKKVALGITGVALLSGTTFAVGPTVNNPPTLIITDRIKESSVLDLGGAGEIFEGNPTNASDTQNIYRFTEAFSLSDYISLDEGAGLADVKWDFAEVDGSDTIVGVNTIEIDDGTNVSTGLATEPSFADVNSSAFATVGAADPLTFRNVPRSTGSTTPVSPSFVDETKIKLFATNVNDSGSQVISTTFDVITTNDTSIAIGDKISAPSTIFTPVVAYDDLDGWYRVFAVGNGAVLNDAPWPISENVEDPVTVPATGDLVPTGAFNLLVTQPNTPLVSIETATDTPTQANLSETGLQPFSPQQAQWGSYTEQVGGDFFNAVQDTIYLTRWSIVSPRTDANILQLPITDLSVGSSTEYDLGRSSINIGGNSMGNIAGDQTYNIYFYAHGPGEVGFYLSTFDVLGNNSTFYPNGHVGQNIGVEKVEVFAFQESDLTGRTVLMNQGGVANSGNFIPATAETASIDDTGYEGEFDLDIWMWTDETQGLRDSIGAAANRNTSSTPVNPVGLRAPQNNTAAELTTTVDTGFGFVQPYWVSLGSILVNADGGPATAPFVASEDELVIADFWISSPDATEFPQARVGYQTTFIDPLGDPYQVSGNDVNIGMSGFYVFTAAPQGLPLSDGTLSTQATALGAGARRARYVFQPQITWDQIPGLTGDTSAKPFIPRAELYSAPGAFEAGQPVNQEDRNGTLRLHRVIVSVYDLPADANTATVPAGLTDPATNP